MEHLVYQNNGVIGHNCGLLVSPVSLILFTLDVEIIKSGFSV